MIFVNDIPGLVCGRLACCQNLLRKPSLQRRGCSMQRRVAQKVVGEHDGEEENGEKDKKAEKEEERGTKNMQKVSRRREQHHVNAGYACSTAPHAARL